MRLLILVAVLALSLVAGGGVALAGGDGIVLDASLEAAGPGECSALTKLKYPWLRCQATAAGGTRLAGNNVSNATWENSRRLPRGYEFIEGTGWWGSDLR